MKTIEEKAKRYDEAIEALRSLFAEQAIKHCDRVNIKDITNIFPELKESKGEKTKRILHSISSKISFHLRDIFTEEEFQCFDAWSHAWLEKQGDQTSANKIEPKFKVKYAGSEYNVFETKDIAGVTFYGIEDEPNHIDYVKADNCEIISGGYGIKENGSPYPTKPAVFSEQNPTWSEEDENRFNNLIFLVECSEENDATKEGFIRFINKLKSLKDRVQLQNIAYYNPYKEVVESIAKMCKHYDNMDVGSLQDFYDNVKVKCKDAKEYDSLFPQSRWKPSDKQMDVLLSEVTAWTKGCPKQIVLESLYQDLKKLREE